MTGSAAETLVGRTLSDRYTVVRRLASGGMGSVYLAEQQRLERTVALKVLHPSPLPGGEPLQQQLLREATLASRLTHPNIVRVFDCGEADGLGYIAMEYVEGPTLAQVLEASAPLPPERVVALMLQLCGALTDAHDCGVIHRDLKPSNILVTPLGAHGFVRVVDFGLAMPIQGAHERHGTLFGTPSHMAPEQIVGAEVGPAADLYALGVILYRMLTGRLPFEASSVDTMLEAHLMLPPPSLEGVDGVPERLAWLTQKLLAKRPGDRIASAATVAAFLRGARITASAPARTARGWGPVGMGVVGLAAAIALVMSVGRELPRQVGPESMEEVAVSATLPAPVAAPPVTVDEPVSTESVTEAPAPVVRRPVVRRPAPVPPPEVTDTVANPPPEAPPDPESVAPELAIDQVDIVDPFRR